MRVARWSLCVQRGYRIRCQNKGDAAAAAGHRETALKLYELALRNLIEAQHNIFTNSPLKKALMETAQGCMDAVIGLADHNILRLNIPFGDQTLPALFHSHNADDPLLFYIPVMDGTKETSSIGPLAARFLSRGFPGDSDGWAWTGGG